MNNLANFIGGKYCPPTGGQYINNFGPRTGSIICKVPRSQAEDVQLAIDAANRVTGEWAATAPLERGRILRRIGDIILANKDELAKMESTDTGKTLKMAMEVDIPRAAQNFHFFADAMVHWESKSHEVYDQAINYTLRHPLGIVGTISPWNLPLYLLTWKMAPALVTGNCVLAKPSELTPMTATKLGEIMNEAGLPHGVANILHGLGPEVGEAIINHQEVKAISFTGGTKSGERVGTLASSQFKKVSLELGGKNPNIIFADAPYEEMLETTLRSSYANQGQICLCGSRIFIESSLYDRFTKDFIERVEKLVIGDPLDPKTDIGAVNSKSHMEKILGMIALAKDAGDTKILSGGEQCNFSGELEGGYYVRPTVIECPDVEHLLNQEEIFGPVVTLIPFDKEQEVIDWANKSKYGLAASIWTQDLSRAHRVASKIDSGIVWVNCWMLRDLRTPFGGMKNSGAGREGGVHSLDFFTQTKNICVKYNL